MASQLHLEGPDLLKFIKEQQDAERDERMKEREARKAEAEAEAKKAEAMAEKARIEADTKKAEVEAAAEKARIEAETKKAEAEAAAEKARLETSIQQKKIEAEERKEERKEAMEAEERKEAREAEERKAAADRDLEERKAARDAEFASQKAKMDYELEAKRLSRVSESEGESTSVNGNAAISTPKLPAFADKTDDLDCYLKRFERFAEDSRWPKDIWASLLSTLLTGKALDVYTAMGDQRITHSEVYDLVKQALLKRYLLTEDGYRNKFRTSKPDT